MATLVLTAVGSVIGGPIGGAIGAIIGQRIDAEIFKPKGRQGPRLGDLSIQTSSYGTHIPKLFGTMRVAGTVIWATDLREERSKSGGGKGQPKTTSYSYSASFAVALSGRPVRAVRRIWADGNLLRGAAGDFKSRTGFRLHLGSDDQEPDPLIAAAEGVGITPGYRGLAYVVFEDLQLADFGNRIPSLTFEVEAEAGPVAIGAIAEELSDGAIRDGASFALLGYAASGDSVRGAVEALGDVLPCSFADDGETLVIAPPLAVPELLAADECGARADGAGGPAEMRRLAAGAVPEEVTLAYYDPARDWQTGLQRASLGAAGRREDRRALPASLDAASAKAVAEYRLAELRAARASAKVHAPWRRAGLRPAAHVRIEGEDGLWRVQRWTLDRWVTTLELVRLPNAAAPVSVGATPGRPVEQPDLPHGATHLLLKDLPLGAERLPAKPLLFAAASGESEGWRRAELSASYDGGGSWEAAGSSAGPAVMGTAETALGPGASALIDARSSVEVKLLNEAMWLEGRTDAALVAGANLALLGSELIQFGRVEPLGGRRFRLSRLLRGRRGTEWAMGLHAGAEAFLLIEESTLVPLEAPFAATGGAAQLSATGIGDGDDGPIAEEAVTGEALRPPSPVHLAAVRTAAGDWDVRWVRRSRNGWAWIDGSDTPLGEEREEYAVRITAPGIDRSVRVTEPRWFYGAAEQAADGLTGPFTVSVVQQGIIASRQATISIS
jgi:hypothetical protein